MNIELILELAEKVYGECDWHESALAHLEQFAELVAEHEREACATIVDETIDFWIKAGYPECAEVRESMNIVESIRNRGQE
jgi:hypothetical protein